MLLSRKAGVRRTGLLLLTTIVATTVTTTAIADNYDYEVGLAYARSSSDASTTVALAFPGTPVQSTQSTDADTVVVSGTWFFDGLSDDRGPKSRAEFLSRASSASLSYSRNDATSSLAIAGGPVQPAFESIDASDDIIDAGLRFVSRESGWFGQGRISSIDSEFDGELNAGPVSGDFSATAYTLGGGKYVGDSTSLEANVIWVDADGSNVTQFNLGLTHVGALGQSWQYGAEFDVTLSDEDEDDGLYELDFALFPTNDVEFGLALGYQKFGDFDQYFYQAFAGWFVSNNVELQASYRRDDPDVPEGVSFDNDTFGLGVRVRF